MSYEFKITKVGCRRSGGNKKKDSFPKHQSMRRAHPHECIGKAYFTYKWVHKFLLHRTGRPVDDVFSEFVKSAKKFNQNENLKDIFYHFIYNDKEELKENIWQSGFYVSNGILNYKKRGSVPKVSKRFKEYNLKHYDTNAFKHLKNQTSSGPILVGKFWIEIKGQVMLLPVWSVAQLKWDSSLEVKKDNGLVKPSYLYTKEDLINLTNFIQVEVIGIGHHLKVYLGYNIYNYHKFSYYPFIVRISDIEDYKKEKFKTLKIKEHDF